MLISGKLYIVATPIGNLDDISLRALKILAHVDQIAAEDTRHSARLMAHHQITTPMVSLHEYNERARCEKMITWLKNGQSLALISDAGTPLISDPGFRLVFEAKKCGIDVVPIPGACAAIAALSASGLPTDRFVFEGFLPVKQQARLNQLEKIKLEDRTILFYEAPHRALSALKDMATVFGHERIAVVARELTKIYESILADTLENLVDHFEKAPQEQQGEWVILVAGAPSRIETIESQDSHLLTCLLEELPVKQAAQLAAMITGKKKNALYKLALTIGTKEIASS